MSSAMTPPLELVVHALQVRQHRSLLALNLLPKLPGAQAPWSRSDQLAPKPLTPMDRRTVSLAVPTSVREVEATSTPPRAIKPVQRIPGGAAPRARKPRPHPALSPARRRHRPFQQLDLDLLAGRLDDHRRRGSPRERGVG
jgi:hypothetical protein